jgi:hypothetical protein
MTLKRVWWGTMSVVASAALCHAACHSKDGGTTSQTNDAAPAARDAGSNVPSPMSSVDGATEEVTSVYPELVGPGDARAVKLCEVLHENPEKKRAACCKQPLGIMVTAECVRMLTGALRTGAVTLDEAGVSACATALDVTYDGCDWVGPFPPPLPKACAGLVTGTLAAGKRCRSSLECAGKLRCKGVGPTTMGTCAEAAPTGEACGGTVDALATYVRDSELEQRHPSCTGYCARFKCGDLGGKDAECTQSRDCQAGLQCLGKKCTARAPAKVGEACPGGVCEEGLACVLGKCTARKAAGQACTHDFECLGGCVKAVGAKPSTPGKCGMRCEIR